MQLNALIDFIPDELGPNICAGSDGEVCVACAMPEGFDFGDHACRRHELRHEARGRRKE